MKVIHTLVSAPKLGQPIKTQKESLNTIIRILNTTLDLHVKPITSTLGGSHKESFEKSMMDLIQDVDAKVESVVFPTNTDQKTTLKPQLFKLQRLLNAIGKNEDQRSTALNFSGKVSDIITKIDHIDSHPKRHKTLSACHFPIH